MKSFSFVHSRNNFLSSVPPLHLLQYSTFFVRCQCFFYSFLSFFFSPAEWEPKGNCLSALLCKKGMPWWAELPSGFGLMNPIQCLPRQWEKPPAPSPPTELFSEMLLFAVSSLRSAFLHLYSVQSKNMLSFGEHLEQSVYPCAIDLHFRKAFSHLRDMFWFAPFRNQTKTNANDPEKESLAWFVFRSLQSVCWSMREPYPSTTSWPVLADS